MQIDSVSKITDDVFARVVLHHSPDGNHIIHCTVKHWSKSCLTYLHQVFDRILDEYPVVMAAFDNSSTKNMKFALMFDGELIGTVGDLNVYKFTKKEP